MSGIAEKSEKSEKSETSERWGTGGRIVIAVWPDKNKWIVSRDRIDEVGDPLTTHTLDVCDTEDEALAEGRREARGRELPLLIWDEGTHRYIEEELRRELPQALA